MEIKRDRYLKRLISKRNNGLIKVITGIRRCGKSYLLFRLYYNYLISEGGCTGKYHNHTARRCRLCGLP